MLAATIPVVGCGEGSDRTSAPSGTSSQESQQSQGQGGAPAEERGGGGEKSIEGFGKEATGSERAAVEGAFTGYLEALADENFSAACSYLAANVRQSLRRLVVKSLKGQGCAGILPRLLSPSAPAFAREQAEGEITKIRAEGDRGFVVFRAPGAKLHQMTMVREGGEWKAGTLGSSVLVPEL